MLVNFDEPVIRTFWEVDDSALDQSCLSPAWAPWHSLAGGHPQVCYDTTYTLLNHITTPFFLRQDINDPLGKTRYVAWALFPSTDDFVSDVQSADALRQLHSGPGRAQAAPRRAGSPGA